ncbi:hypothetical protein [Cylindrospermum sp. FACHB-282]|uniref:hypothetical protein n=1 Tax=Cylindrospermum sp. FACHB-282 TaxID=2692794 RepID=UPI001687AC05|nr:hypothetical protein [Cylindrospermum sp. FACHB-282]MBD2386137.1 hypothetical protein [Cylindrospermum sp. FACHB-282]
MVTKQNILQANAATTRLLLALWDLGGREKEVAKGQLTKRIISKGKKVADFQEIFAELEKQGAIAISKKGYSLTSPKGLEVLGAGLRHSEFKFEGTIVGTWVANALLKWISQIDVAVVASGDGVKSASIASYDEFKSVALEVYDKLNYEYNFNHLVPIYRIRREIGDRISRTEFNDFLLEMQADDIFQLQGGTIEDNASDKVEDSISTKLDGLRCYAIRL